MARRIAIRHLISLATAIAILTTCSGLFAQRRPFRIVRPNFEMRLGNGRGAQFGGPNWGLQIGGGQGVRYNRFGYGYGAALGVAGYPQPESTPSAVYPQPRQPPRQPGDTLQRSQQPPFGPQPNAYADQYYGASSAEPTIANAAENDSSQVPSSVAEPMMAPADPDDRDVTPDVDQASLRASPTSTNSMSELIQITLPETAKNPLSFSLNGKAFSVAPGGSVNIDGRESWIISFSPSVSAKTKKYTLDQPGKFLFKDTQSGWNLVRVNSTSGNANTRNAGAIVDLKPKTRAPENVEKPVPEMESEPKEYSVLERATPVPDARRLKDRRFWE